MHTCTVPDCSNKARKTQPTCSTHNYYDDSGLSVVVRCKAAGCYGWRGIGLSVQEAHRMLLEHREREHTTTREKTNW